MSKKSKPTPVPATVLVITLEPDGNGSLLARRGELAHLSQFIYHGLSEIVAAIQVAATELIAIEQNPPGLDASTVQPENAAPNANAEPESQSSAADINDDALNERAVTETVCAMPFPTDPQPRLM